ncbi:MAG: MerR family transcriptional regulator [Chitinophagia bacterium]|nr:MerR family transcriptional regulator [Chitinophagia bacterium]
MNTDQLILVEQIVMHHRIDQTFIPALSEFGLVELVVQEGHAYLHEEQLADVERLIRLHYELGINLEGLDVIFQLLQKIAQLESELLALRAQVAA